MSTQSSLVRERPILFSSPMVRAILEGHKTQTRRVIKPQPVSQGMMSFGEAWKWNEGGEGWFSGVTADQIKNPNYGLIKSLPCPYGGAGDRLYVKEATWQWCRKIPNGTTKTGRKKYRYQLHGTVDTGSVIYAADHPQKPERVSYADPNMVWHYKHARFMQKHLSRITLEPTDVRVQRVQEISESDAEAEGVSATSYSEQDVADIQISDAAPHIKELATILGAGTFTAKGEYATLWNSINGKTHPWASNDWIWALTFRRIA